MLSIKEQSRLCLAIIIEAFIFTYNSRILLFKLGGVFVLGIALLESLIFYFNSEQQQLNSIIVGFYVVMIGFIALLFAVAWHNICQKGTVHNQHIFDLLRWRKSTTLYLWWIIIFMFISAMYIMFFVSSLIAANGYIAAQLLAVLGQEVTANSTGNNNIAELFVVGIFIYVMYLFSHVWLVLPAVAVDPTIKFMTVYDATRNYRALVFLLSLCIFTAEFCKGFLNVFINAVAGKMQITDSLSLLLLTSITLHAVSFIVAAFTLSCLSIAWRKILSQQKTKA